VSPRSNPAAAASCKRWPRPWPHRCRNRTMRHSMSIPSALRFRKGSRAMLHLRHSNICLKMQHILTACISLDVAARGNHSSFIDEWPGSADTCRLVASRHDLSMPPLPLTRPERGFAHPLRSRLARLWSGGAWSESPSPTRASSTDSASYIPAWGVVRGRQRFRCQSHRCRQIICPS